MKKISNAFLFAFKGLQYTFLHETNFKIELFFAVAAVICSYVFKISNIQWLVILLNIGMVLSAELFNTTIEHLCNVISKEINPQIKIIKDVAAAAVLVAAITAVVCGILIFVPIIF